MERRLGMDTKGKKQTLANDKFFVWNLEAKKEKLYVKRIIPKYYMVQPSTLNYLYGIFINQNFKMGLGFLIKLLGFMNIIPMDQVSCKGVKRQSGVVAGIHSQNMLHFALSSVSFMGFVSLPRFSKYHIHLPFWLYLSKNILFGYVLFILFFRLI